MISYRTDALIPEAYDGTSWAPVQDNFIANTTRTANSAGVTTVETLIDSVTFTAVAGRRYRVTWMTSLSNSAGSNNDEARLRYAAGASVSSAGTLIGGNFSVSPGANFGYPLTLSRTVSGIAAGQTTVGAFLIVSFGAGTLTSTAAANSATELWVEDIGR
jgi:hypothetical protein